MILLYLIIVLNIFDLYAGNNISKCFSGASCHWGTSADDNNGAAESYFGDGDEKNDSEGYFGDDEKDENEDERNNVFSRRRDSRDVRLIERVREGDRARVAILLNRNANVNTTDSAGDSILCIACDHKYSEIVDMLLAHKANANHSGFRKRTPLHCAAEGSHPSAVSIIASLVAANAQLTINAKDEHGYFPLNNARTTSTVKALLLCRADYNKYNGNGLTPFEQSVTSSCIGCIPSCANEGVRYTDYLACAQTFVALGAINECKANDIRIVSNRRVLTLFNMAFGVTTNKKSYPFLSREVLALNRDQDTLNNDEMHPFIRHQDLFGIYQQAMSVKKLVNEQDWCARGDAELFTQYMQKDPVYLMVKAANPDCCSLEYLVGLTPAFISTCLPLPDSIARLVDLYACQYYLDTKITTVELDPTVQAFIPWLVMQRIRENKNKNRCKKEEDLQ